MTSYGNIDLGQHWFRERLVAWRHQAIPRTNVNASWYSDAIWRHRSGSTLAQVMACCLMAPSHYLNQCWLNIYVALWHSAENVFTRNAQDIYPWYQFENDKTSNTSSRGQWVNLSPLRSSNNPLKAITGGTSQPSVTEISLNVADLNFLSNLPEANELSEAGHWLFIISLFQSTNQAYSQWCGMFSFLSNRGWMINICVSRLGHHWFRY